MQGACGDGAAAQHGAHLLRHARHEHTPARESEPRISYHGGDMMPQPFLVSLCANCCSNRQNGASDRKTVGWRLIGRSGP